MESGLLLFAVVIYGSSYLLQSIHEALPHQNKDKAILRLRVILLAKSRRWSAHWIGLLRAISDYRGHCFSSS